MIGEWGGKDGWFSEAGLFTTLIWKPRETLKGFVFAHILQSKQDDLIFDDAVSHSIWEPFKKKFPYRWFAGHR